MPNHDSMPNTVSDRLFLGRVIPGMDVCDVTGEKVGSIAHIHRFDEATDESVGARAGDELIEVKTGFLGMGKHLYIPMSAVQEVLTDSIFLSKSREVFGELGYEERPSYFAQLH
jgi:hypothetical protein